MGGVTIGPRLAEYAQRIPEDQAIVELGAWLGGGTQFLVREHGQLYVYDYFFANPSEVRKARKFGVKLTIGQDTLPIVRERVPQAIFTKGDIREATYSGPPIGMYVDDASKEVSWSKAMETFEPHFADSAILFLMDYDFPPCVSQRAYSNKWRLIDRRIGDTCCAIFQC